MNTLCESRRDPETHDQQVRRREKANGMRGYDLSNSRFARRTVILESVHGQRS